MAAGTEAPDPADMTADQFAHLVRAWGEDGYIVEGIRAAGVEVVLDRIFGEMAERFRPSDERRGDVLWLIDVRGDQHAYVLHMRGDDCTAEQGRVDDPRVTFHMDLASFARLVTGVANPIRLLITRRLKVSGDLLFARRVPASFEMPTG